MQYCVKLTLLQVSTAQDTQKCECDANIMMAPITLVIHTGEEFTRSILSDTRVPAAKYVKRWSADLAVPGSTA